MYHLSSFLVIDNSNKFIEFISSFLNQIDNFNNSLNIVNKSNAFIALPINVPDSSISIKFSIV